MVNNERPDPWQGNPGDTQENPRKITKVVSSSLAIMLVFEPCALRASFLLFLRCTQSTCSQYPLPDQEISGPHRDNRHIVKELDGQAMITITGVGVESNGIETRSFQVE